MAEKTTALILAVNSSNIYRGRSLLTLGGRTVLEHVKRRLERASRVGDIVLCTSEEAEDDSLAALAAKTGIKCVRSGKYENLLARLLGAYKELGLERAIITRGDSPFLDSAQCDRLCGLRDAGNADYAYSEHMFGLPLGTGCEIIGRNVLETMLGSGKIHNYTQRVSSFIRLHENDFRTAKLEFDRPNPDLRLTIEYPADYDLAQELLNIAGEDADVAALLDVFERHPLLSKLNKPPEVREIGLDKLLLFPEKIKAIQEEKCDPLYPVSVELTLTNNCNLNCKWCSDGRLRVDRPGALEPAACARLIEDLAAHGTRGLVIEGGGEPTMYPQFKDMVRLALDKKLAVGLITNGVKFEYPELVPSMEWIRVSLDADSPATYREWKGRDSFYGVLDNIRRMCEVKGDCVIGVGYVVTRHNLKYLEEVTILLYDYGVNYIYLRPVIDNPDMHIKENLYYLKKYETNTFSVMIHAMEENSITGNNNLPCASHSLSCVVAGDGSVFICGRLNIHDWLEPIGNINDSGFHEIWNGAVRSGQAAQLRDAAFCAKWCPECRMTKFNTLFDKTSKIKTRNFI